MIARLNRLMILAGQRGTGKTTFANKLAEVSKKSIIVVDTDMHPFYEPLETVSISGLKKWRGDRCKIIDDNTNEILLTLDKYQSNAFILMEDCAKYMGSNMTEQEKRFVINMRKRNFDVIMMFHSLSDIPPYLCKNYNDLVLFKVDDNLQVPQRKFNNWERIKESVERVVKNKNYNYCEVISK